MKSSIESNLIPEIDDNVIIYKWEEFNLIRMSDSIVEKTGTPLDLAQWWLLKIDWNNIWCYWIPDIFLPYTLINEIECPDVIAWKWFCLEWLKKELIQVPAWLLNEYLIWRLQFFKNMEEYYQLEDFLDDVYAWEMRECYLYLIWEIQRRKTISEISWLIETTLD